MTGALLSGLAPLSRADARVLILGSMPGEASLRAGAYYAHPRNLFWPILGAALGFDPALPYARRVRCLLDARIAVWDVLAACRRDGSLDGAIRDPRHNDFAAFLASHPACRHVLFNGAKAEAEFVRHARRHLDAASLRCRRLPSTSPANAAIPRGARTAAWRSALHEAGVRSPT